jgi:hypothetical protein
MPSIACLSGLGRPMTAAHGIVHRPDVKFSLDVEIYSPKMHSPLGAENIPSELVAR